MKDNAQNSFRDRLLEERAEITKQARTRQDARTPVGADGVPDTGDRAAHSAECEVYNRIADSEGKLLDKIEFALQRLDAGVYGQCDDCGGKIAYARLRAKPTASLCLACQTEKESQTPKTRVTLDSQAAF